MIIMMALLVAHFLDKSFYTLKESNDSTSDKIAIFAIVMRAVFICLWIYAFLKIIAVVKKELFVQIQWKIMGIHIGVLGF